MNLPRKLRAYKAVEQWSYSEIAEFVGTTAQSVKNWCHNDRCPAKLKYPFAERLVELTNGKITMKDCGY